MSELNSMEQGLLWGVIAVAFISLAYAYWLWRDTLRRPKGTPEMQKVWLAIKTGANAYLQRQLRTILPILLLLAILLFFSIYVVQPTEQALTVFNDDIAAAAGEPLAYRLPKPCRAPRDKRRLSSDIHGFPLPASDRDGACRPAARHCPRRTARSETTSTTTRSPGS